MKFQLLPYKSQVELTQWLWLHCSGGYGLGGNRHCAGSRGPVSGFPCSSCVAEILRSTRWCRADRRRQVATCGWAGWAWTSDWGCHSCCWRCRDVWRGLGRAAWSGCSCWAWADWIRSHHDLFGIEIIDIFQRLLISLIQKLLLVISEVKIRCDTWLTSIAVSVAPLCTDLFRK